MYKCVFAGTFDPFTVGHESIVKECEKRFDEVFLVVGENPDKKPFFPLSIRVSALNGLYPSGGKVRVIGYRDIPDYAAFLKSEGVTAYVRGIRDEKDLAYERAAEKRNEQLYPFVKTEYIAAEKGFEKVSSTYIRGLIGKGEDFSSLVPEKTFEEYKEYIRKTADK